MGRYRVKSPGRVAAARRLNELGLRGIGGRRPSHGLIALEQRLKRGLDPTTHLGRLHAARRAGYVADLGGEEACSEMEKGIADRLADLDLVRGLLNAQREGTRRIASAKALHAHALAVTRNALAYVQAVRLVGPGRRPRELNLAAASLALDAEEEARGR